MESTDLYDETALSRRPVLGRIGPAIDRWVFGPQRFRAVPWTVWEVLMLAPMVIGGIWRGVLIRFKLSETVEFEMFNQLAYVLLLSLPFVVVFFRGAKLYQIGLHLCRVWRNALAGFVTYFIAAPAVTLTYFLALQFFERTPHKIEQLLVESHSIEDITKVAIVAVSMAPFLEELAFRGILLPWLRRVAGPWRAILINSFIFAIAHFDAWPAPIPLFVFALFLCYLAQRSSSLAGPIILHATFNAANLAILVLGSELAP